MPTKLQREREQMGIIGVVLIAIALVGIVRLFSGCASWQQAGRATAEVTSRMAAGSVTLARPVCEARRAICKAEGRLDPADHSKCQELVECQRAEVEIARANVLIQWACDAALAAIKISDQPSATNALATAARLAAELRTALQALGVRVP